MHPVISLQGGRWQLSGETNTFIEDNQFLVSITTLAKYGGITFQVRGFDGKNYYLTTNEDGSKQKLTLDLIEPGLYGKNCPHLKRWVEFGRLSQK